MYFLYDNFSSASEVLLFIRITSNCGFLQFINYLTSHRGIMSKQGKTNFVGLTSSVLSSLLLSQNLHRLLNPDTTVIGNIETKNKDIATREL